MKVTTTFLMVRLPGSGRRNRVDRQLGIANVSGTATAGRGLIRLRLLSFISTASAAESLRSRCGSVRGAPELSSQTSPVAAPQVGQRTDNICFGVSSLVFMTA